MRTMSTETGPSALTGATLVILAAALWATVGVAVKLVPAAAALPPEVLGLARTLLAGPMILLVSVRGVTGLTALARTIDRPRLIGFALSGVIFQVCLFRSFDALGVTLTVVLTVCLPPVIATIWSMARGVSFGRGALVALGLAITGLGLCASAKGLDGPAGNRAWGLFLAFAASLAFVWMSAAARSLSRSAPPMLVAGLGLTLSGLMFCALLPALPGASIQAFHALTGDPQLLALVVYLAAIPTALAYVCYCAGMARCRSTAAGLTASMIEPAIAALLATLFLHERLGLGESLGCFLMAVAILVLMRAEAQTRPVTTARLTRQAGFRAARFAATSRPFAQSAA
jgi:DME family drug/metabolite transporter